MDNCFLGLGIAAVGRLHHSHFYYSQVVPRYGGRWLTGLGIRDADFIIAPRDIGLQAEKNPQHAEALRSIAGLQRKHGSRPLLVDEGFLTESLNLKRPLTESEVRSAVVDIPDHLKKAWRQAAREDARRQVGKEKLDAVEELGEAIAQVAGNLAAEEEEPPPPVFVKEGRGGGKVIDNYDNDEPCLAGQAAMVASAAQAAVKEASLMAAQTRSCMERVRRLRADVQQTFTASAESLTTPQPSNPAQHYPAPASPSLAPVASALANLFSGGATGSTTVSAVEPAWKAYASAVPAQKVLHPLIRGGKALLDEDHAARAEASVSQLKGKAERWCARAMESAVARNDCAERERFKEAAVHEGKVVQQLEGALSCLADAARKLGPPGSDSGEAAAFAGTGPVLQQHIDSLRGEASVARERAREHREACSRAAAEAEKSLREKEEAGRRVCAELEVRAAEQQRVEVEVSRLLRELLQGLEQDAARCADGLQEAQLHASSAAAARREASEAACLAAASAHEEHRISKCMELFNVLLDFHATASSLIADAQRKSEARLLSLRKEVAVSHHKVFSRFCDVVGDAIKGSTSRLAATHVHKRAVDLQLEVACQSLGEGDAGNKELCSRLEADSRHLGARLSSLRSCLAGQNSLYASLAVPLLGPEHPSLYSRAVGVLSQTDDTCRTLLVTHLEKENSAIAEFVSKGS